MNISSIWSHQPVGLEPYQAKDTVIEQARQYAYDAGFADALNGVNKGGQAYVDELKGSFVQAKRTDGSAGFSGDEVNAIMKAYVRGWNDGSEDGQAKSRKRWIGAGVLVAAAGGALALWKARK